MKHPAEVGGSVWLATELEISGDTGGEDKTAGSLFSRVRAPAVSAEFAVPWSCLPHCWQNPSWLRYEFPT
jgi:hypothetical protein